MSTHPAESEAAFSALSTPGSESGSNTVSAIVPVYNGGRDFEQCLTRLLHADPRPDEIIVVGDGDTDGSSDYAARLGVRAVCLAARGGPARARNRGAAMAQGDVLLFVDADVLVHHDVVTQVRDALSSTEPGIVAAFGCYDDQPTAPDFLSQYKNLLHHYVHSTASEEASTFWTGCGAIRRDVFLAVGGFDESYREPCIEDIELGYRLKRAGLRIRLHKALQVTHLKHWTAGSLIKTDFFRRALPWAALILRDRRFINDLNVSAPNRISVAAVHALVLVLAGMVAARQAAAGLALTLLAVILAALLLVLNRGVYAFMHQERGMWFAIRSIPWHWLSLLYSGLAFAICCLQLVYSRAVTRHPTASLHPSDDAWLSPAPLRAVHVRTGRGDGGAMDTIDE